MPSGSVTMKVAICRGKRPKESGLGMKAMPGRSNVFDQRDHDTVLTDLYTYLVIVEQRACGGQALGKRRIGPAKHFAPRPEERREKGAAGLAPFPAKSHIERWGTAS